jgi:hypothetical protein
MYLSTAGDRAGQPAGGAAVGGVRKIWASRHPLTNVRQASGYEFHLGLDIAAPLVAGVRRSGWSPGSN